MISPVSSVSPAPCPSATVAMVTRVPKVTGVSKVSFSRLIMTRYGSRKVSWKAAGTPAPWSTQPSTRAWAAASGSWTPPMDTWRTADVAGFTIRDAPPRRRAG
ncbi:hypothetical protein GCM10020000_69320 [Streptomyces olivoverticillatus]